MPLPYVYGCFILVSLLIHSTLFNQVTITIEQMNSNQTEHINRIITELKTGSFLTKQKRNGEQYLRHFYLDETEEFLSYHQTEKFFSQAHRCKYN